MTLETYSIALGIPHKYPFVLVDRIVEAEYMKRSVGYKNISYNEPWVSGHFPENAVYPGVLMIETMAQVGGFMFICNNEPRKMMYLCGVNQFKVMRPVVPGDVLFVESELTEHIGHLYQIKCTAKVDNKKVASGLFSLAESR